MRLRHDPRSTALRVALVLVPWLATVPTLRAEDGDAGPPGRTPWTTSRVQGSPEPPPPYVTERVYPSLTFQECLDLAAPPGGDRLYVVELAGKIYSFVPGPDPSAELVIDLKAAIPEVQQVYALAFHPDFESNRYCYVCYVAEPELEDGSRIVRFRVNETDPPTIDPASATTIVTWLSGGHNGCCLKFGPDGFLYVSTGDGGPANPPDPLRAGQDVSNLLSAILRIDVDHAEAGRNYRIPPDNPFVATDGARGEIWAYGLRNPWRMSFDPNSGDLWVGDVGWERWEMLNRIERGGNYGWAVTEGLEPTHPEWPRGPTPILPPTIVHPHSESSSITDGLTYRGTRLEELRGSHIYGDYDTGKVWAFRYEDGVVVGHRELADTTHRIVAFGEDREGEPLLMDHTAGTLHRLVPNPTANSADAFPRTLGASGLFEDVAAHEPAPGVVRYAINAPAWEDHASSERLVAIPDAASITAEGEAWTYPKDSVLVKTLTLEASVGDPSSRQRVETQLLHFDGLDWQAYSYAWNAEQADAELVASAGEERIIDVVDASAPGGSRQQVWRFAGRAECLRCHNRWSGPPLAFHPAQLDRAIDRAGKPVSQLEALSSLRLLDRTIESGAVPRLARLDDHQATIDQRSRSYLHVNCSHCHRLHAGSAVLSKMTYDLDLDRTDMLDVRPTQGTFGIHDARVIAPGDPFRSVLYYRMAKLGNGRMPHIGSTEVDREGLEVIYTWIHGLHAPQANGEADLADLDAEGVDRLLDSTHDALRLLREIDTGSLPAHVTELAIAKGSIHPDSSIRDLYERFLPPDQRIQRIGGTVDTAQILALAGDASRGRALYFETEGLQCKSCHLVGGQGIDLGPDLSAIGAKYDRGQLLESILEPSKTIEPKYLIHLVETTDGRVLSGLVAEQGAAEVVLRDATNAPIRVDRSEIEQFVPQAQSLMPELLLKDLTAQEVADLLEFLGSLR